PTRTIRRSRRRRSSGGWSRCVGPGTVNGSHTSGDESGRRRREGSEADEADAGDRAVADRGLLVGGGPRGHRVAVPALRGAVRAHTGGPADRGRGERLPARVRAASPGVAAPDRAGAGGAEWSRTGRVRPRRARGRGRGDPGPRRVRRALARGALVDAPD